ncbi:mesenteric estrogen-dependent adipogenesis protein [Callorhinchus milii]|uniref:mesenteric estrogen-dependent adipogenesis protein n=1 Tax=Callorhinchus milii TaxID=7868 RepID=UPI000457436C|nr:mesenteric estrogen-dependent adipogenesis protein [Callorhinchus milii]|eukprot:gi/632948237/ref/XP_007889480.1/ PREDICTED: mesenteric estrogen-dependent adipogenesis protein [Callorhinchus milii]
MSAASVTDLKTISATAIDCEIMVLPMELLLSLQRSHFILKGKNIQISQETGAGYNVISNGQISLEGQRFNLANCIQRKITLNSLKEHRSFQETILSKPMVFFTNVMVAGDSTIVFAVIVNIRHPRMQFEIGDSMNDAISTAVGASYILQFNLKTALQSYFSLNGGYKTDGLGLDFTCEFKRDSSSDDFYWLGRSTKIKELNGKIVNLSCTTEDEKCQVKQAHPRIKRVVHLIHNHM